MEARQFDTIIVGAGIVGSALAAHLSKPKDHGKILLIDRSFDDLLGSTGLAPGLVGQLNVSPVLTKLAQESVDEYKAIPDAFNTVGCMELASTDAGFAEQDQRLGMANERGVSAKILAYEETLGMLPPFVREASFRQALYFPDDGLADGKVITEAYRQQSNSSGVQFEEASVAEILRDRNQVTGVRTEDGHPFKARQVVLATGIWTTQLLLKTAEQYLPLFPVAHPYVYSNTRLKRSVESPFIRWPERHVYARDHGDRDGFGTYDHFPLEHNPEASAAAEWNGEEMDTAVSKAMAKCLSTSFGGREGASLDETWSDRVAEKTSGVFAVTPDGLSLVGALGPEGLYIAAAVWVTQAAGCVRFLTKLLKNEDVDDEVRSALDPRRFENESMREDLREKALRTYNDIYGKDRE